MPRIDAPRLLADLRRLAEFGRYKTGVHRPTYSAEDMAARQWFVAQLTDAGLAASIDGIGNCFGRPRRGGPRLLIGSHIESQNHAGWLDGALACLPLAVRAESPDLRARALAAVSEVVDPELPVLTIADLGVLRAVEVVDDRIEVTITPTYSGCPAMNMITVEIGLALERAGIRDAHVRTILHPAWTTDWMSEEGRRKLKEYGVAPPSPGGGRRALFGEEIVACPLCGSQDTERLAEFGSTSCKALWRCRACREPFDYFKCH